MNYRPYQQITRRESRQIHVGRVPVGGDAPITVQTMTNTLTTDVAGTVAQIRRAETAGVDIVRVSCPDQESALALQGHRAPGERAGRRRHPFPLPARDRGGRERRGLPAHQPGQYRQPGARARGDQGRARPRLLDAHRRQRRLAGAASAREIRRAEPRGAGRDPRSSTPRSCRTTTSTSSRSA